jgi:hypothetical protein
LDKERRGGKRREVALWRSNSYCFFLLARLFFLDMFPPSLAVAADTTAAKEGDASKP